MAAQVATFGAGEAAANPPAPSSVPDPPKTVAPKPGELATRIKRHDGGCFAYAPSGGVTKTACPAGVTEPGEELIREPETGECVILEPWGEEPKEVTCPPELVPAGFVPPSPQHVASKVTPKYAVASVAPPPQPVGLDPSAPAKSTGCARCSVMGAPLEAADTPLAPLAPLAGLGVVGVALARRRAGRRPGTD